MNKWTLCLQTLFISILHWIGDFRLNAKTEKQNLKLKATIAKKNWEITLLEIPRGLTLGFWGVAPKLLWDLGSLGAVWCPWEDTRVHSGVVPLCLLLAHLVLCCLFCFPPNNVSRDDCNFKEIYISFSSVLTLNSHVKFVPSWMYLM